MVADEPGHGSAQIGASVRSEGGEQTQDLMNLSLASLRAEPRPESVADGIDRHTIEARQSHVSQRGRRLQGQGQLSRNPDSHRGAGIHEQIDW